MLKRLYLHHFRNYTQVEIPFSPGVNWIVGKNAQGKTNLLEAIYLLCFGRSFRTHQLSQLIQKDAPFFYIECEIEKDGVTQTIKLSFDGETKKVEHNSTVYSHFTPLLGLLPHVLYAPEDIALVSGAPAFRRRFFDMHLSQLNPLYLHHLARFYKALRQRNELLKSKKEETLDSWELAMGHSAHYLMEKRKELIDQLKVPLDKMMHELSCGTDTLAIGYENSLPFEGIAAYLKTQRKKEMHLKTTLYGPHRDDIDLKVGGLSAKSYASAGQKHSAVAALRLSQWHHLKDHTDQLPYFSIDDFGAHLDQGRQEHFQEKLKGLGQIFLTSPVAKDAVFEEKHIIEIGSGQVLEIGRA